MTAILAAFIFTLSLSTAFSQDLYINFSTDIYKIENDRRLTLITTANYSIFPITDIAITPSGKMFGISLGNILQINPENGHVDIVSRLPFGDESVTLVCDHQHQLYTLSCSGMLYKYDLLRDSLQLISYLEDSSPGDITFFRGNIVFPSVTKGDFMAYNLSSGKTVRIICRPSQPEEIYGMANVFDRCGKERLYATDASNHLYELDVEKNEIHFIGQFEMSPRGYGIYGMASSSEHHASGCKYEFKEVTCVSLPNKT